MGPQARWSGWSRDREAVGDGHDQGAGDPQQAFETAGGPGRTERMGLREEAKQGAHRDEIEGPERSDERQEQALGGEESAREPPQEPDDYHGDEEARHLTAMAEPTQEQRIEEVELLFDGERPEDVPVEAEAERSGLARKAQPVEAEGGQGQPERSVEAAGGVAQAEGGAGLGPGHRHEGARTQGEDEGQERKDAAGAARVEAAAVEPRQVQVSLEDRPRDHEPGHHEEQGHPVGAVAGEAHPPFAQQGMCGKGRHA